MTRTYRFVWVDVFSRRPLEGNQLAVFPEAGGLRDDEMQAIARETHLSETTFVFPTDDARDRQDGFRTRIFAVAFEMPFAGHPTLGTAAVLAEARGWDEAALALKVGRIPVRFSVRDGARFGVMDQRDPTFGQVHEPKAVARALGIEPAAFDPALPIETVSTGVPFAIVPFRSSAELGRLRPSWAAMEGYLSGTDAQFLYLVARATHDPAATLHARMIFSGGEDPATGSAAGPAVAWLVRHGAVPSGEEVVIEQGLEVLRPSRIYGSAVREGDAVRGVRIGGYCTRVVEGSISL